MKNTKFKVWLTLYILGILVGGTGVALVIHCAGWGVAVGIYLAIFGNNLTQPMPKDAI